MRINRFVALATGISRRQADKLIQGRKVFINDLPAQLSDHATTADRVKVDGKRVFIPDETILIMLNKPKGYVCSRNGQGSNTIYDLLPEAYRNLKPVGRLDKESSGLILLTDDGHLAHELTHPKFSKDKVYEVSLNTALKETDRLELVKGVKLDDGISHLSLRPMDRTDMKWQVTMQEGRNRQIRRTFSALGYSVNRLHRTKMGKYSLKDLEVGKFLLIK